MACIISEKIHWCSTVRLFGEQSKFGFFLTMGVGRNLTMGGMVDWELTKAGGANGEKLVVGKAVGRWMVHGMFYGLILNFVWHGVFALNTGQGERSMYCIAMVYFWWLFGNHNSCEVRFISALEEIYAAGTRMVWQNPRYQETTKMLSIKYLYQTQDRPLLALCRF